VSVRLRFPFPQSQGNEVFRGIAPTMMTTTNSTRVQAPAFLLDQSRYLSVTFSNVAPMMVGAQSLYQDGITPTKSGKQAGQHIDLRKKIRLATWNVMTLSGTGYQVALVRELARHNISIAGITEVRLPGSDCR